MNRTQRAASTNKVTPRTITERLTRSLRTYGSRMREKLNGVYSVKPASASRGSNAYWYEHKKYTPIVKGRMT
jgi:hypothetical protein